jgi:hypothetical protein
MRTALPAVGLRGELFSVSDASTLSLFASFPPRGQCFGKPLYLPLSSVALIWCESPAPMPRQTAWPVHYPSRMKHPKPIFSLTSDHTPALGPTFFHDSDIDR